MKILFIVASPYAWQSGIWFHRNHLPSMALRKRGHATQLVALGKKTPEDLLNWSDTVIFGRTYHPSSNPIEKLREFKGVGKRILYDIDDDFWTVNPDNPSVNVSNAFKDQYEGFIRECDAVITPSKVLAKKIQKLEKKKVFLCPNMSSSDYYNERPREHKELIIGYAGAASHWKDLHIIVEPLIALRKKYEFQFVLHGVAGGPLEGEMYTYDQILLRNLKPERESYYREALDWYSKMKELQIFHIPFYPPELFPHTLSKADFDIGLAPLEDNEFNRSKSNVKFYEYASVGTVTLASDVLPYKEEVNYRAKNTVKDWTKKLEKLIVDKKFREKTLKQQQGWVLKNRTVDTVGLDWELACQKEGGLKVLNQQK